MLSLESSLVERLASAFAAVGGAPGDPVLRRSQHADYQANGALALAKRLGRNPRDVAGEVIRRVDVADLCSAVEIAGPGFINLTVCDAALDRFVARVVGDERLGVQRRPDPDVVVVDYSAPNVAKEMHVGHLRSTIIGDAAVRLLEWLGHEVVRKNHLGDWGTPFGMLIEHLLDLGEAEAAQELSVGDLDDFYRSARQKFDSDESFRGRSRQRVVMLQAGDEPTLRLWRLLIEQSKRYFLTVYGRLGVKLEPGDFAGESAYNEALASVVTDLEHLEMLKNSDGALCVFPEGFTNRHGDPLPLIVMKGDGGYGYDTTDLAAIRERTRELKATRLLYVVGLPQDLHFRMIFRAAAEAGWLEPPARAEHIGFGSVLGADGKTLRSRAGKSVKLIDLLDEAVDRAAAVVREKNPDLDPTEAAAVADAVGIGAVKYADLSTDRTKDYVFDYDRMLSFDGNTAPYLQYAHTRVQAIFRRADVHSDQLHGPVSISEPAEHELAVELLRFPDLLGEIEQTLDFHRLCVYLYGVATSFSAFYEKCPILRAEPDIRVSRLTLCRVTAETLARGLDILGIAVMDRM